MTDLFSLPGRLRSAPQARAPIPGAPITGAAVLVDGGRKAGSP